MNLPKFKYHPNPLETGSVEKSETVCECCNKATGYVYTGPVFAEEELYNCICPWCVANGKAHEKFDAEFTDYESIGEKCGWEEVSNEIKVEVVSRTPGFSGWQQEKWWTHCSDAAAYIGRASGQDVLDYGEDLIESLKEDSGLEGEQWENFRKALDKSGSPTAYVFKCIHCGKLGGYQDSD